MKLINLIIVVILSIGNSLNLFSQNTDIVRITLEQGKSDVLEIGANKVNKAYVYGTQESIIQFLINDKYVEHQMDKGIVYNFLFTEYFDGKIADKQWTKEQLISDSNKILIVTEDTISYKSIYRMVYKQDGQARQENKTFQLGEVNNLKIFVSNKLTDTTIFHKNQDIVKVTLDKSKSDIFQVDGKIISKVNIYGTKENIIRFLINDKYIKHKMDEGANYNFITSSQFSKFFDYFSDKTPNKKILIVVADKDEYKKISEQNTITPQNTIKLEKINNIDIFVLSPDKIINP